MFFKRSLALTLILSTSLLQTSLAAFADSAPPSSNTAEFTLISSALVLGGKKLSQSELETGLTQALVNYNQAAPADGRTERTEQALVALGVDTPEQAQAFGAEVQEIATSLSGSRFESAQDAQNALAAQLGKVAASSRGAEFSSCDAAKWAVGTAVIAGLAASVIGWTYGVATNTTSGWPAYVASYGWVGSIVGALVGISVFNTWWPDGCDDE